MFANNKDILSVEEVAEYLGVGVVTIYRWCREGRLPCLKMGKFWRIRREALEDFLKRRERSATRGRCSPSSALRRSRSRS